MTVTVHAPDVLRAAIAPIRASFLDRARREGVDDLGQPVKRVRASGGEPCRDVLRRAEAGEELILASYSPFTKPGPYKEYGPIFILARHAHEATDRDELAIGSAHDYLRERFVIRAYSKDEEILDAELVDASDAETTAERFFANPDVAFLHVRFPTYGCFACRLDRPARA
ncbi:MAG TPA: DUF1203 domain-containing protein [Thermoanaerobaculia bacterium]|nr:DUF1203 domain-containing protein [Thermoanaerobaculia bacterium]